MTAIKMFNFLQDKNCAELVTENRNINFTNAIRKLAKNKELRDELGNSGYQVIRANYSKKVVVSKYSNLLNSL
jgi:glycosyltransferase involved in cell wall biosynthesis